MTQVCPLNLYRVCNDTANGLIGCIWEIMWTIDKIIFLYI